jgi:hypothetical protein
MKSDEHTIIWSKTSTVFFVAHEKAKTLNLDPDQLSLWYQTHKRELRAPMEELAHLPGKIEVVPKKKYGFEDGRGSREMVLLFAPKSSAKDVCVDLSGNMDGIVVVAIECLPGTRLKTLESVRKGARSQ